ncbi:MAG: ParB/RepB/Spo0J family partition protein [Candidatus Promineifilaceae bacterium]
MAKKKQTGLGKGLGALIRSTDGATPTGEVSIESDADALAKSGLRMVKVKEIRPNPYQPRTHFEEEPLEELADSIREHGLIQPLIVSQVAPNDYTLIAGERRWQASQRAGLHQVPVVVKNDITALEMLELALIENIQREDLNDLEEGLAYRQLMDEFNMTHAQVAKRVGKARTTITNTVRLLDLDPRVQEAVVNNEISGGHARALHSLGPDEQTAVMGSIIKNGHSVRQTEQIVRKIKLRSAPKKKARPQLPPELADIEKQFRTRLGTRVSIEPGKDGGKVVIHYYSDEELSAVYDTIVGEENAL